MAHWDRGIARPAAAAIAASTAQRAQRGAPTDAQGHLPATVFIKDMGVHAKQPLSCLSRLPAVPRRQTLGGKRKCFCAMTSWKVLRAPPLLRLRTAALPQPPSAGLSKERKPNARILAYRPE